MNILHVLWSLEFGGIEKLVLDLASEQRRRGENVRVLVGQGRGHMAPLFAEVGHSVIDARLKNGFDPGWFRWREIRSVMKEAQVIHMHTFNPTFARFARASGRPIVFTEHGNFGHGRETTWRDKIKRTFMKWFLNRDVRYITFNSHYSRRLALARYGLQGVPNKVVYNGIRFPEDDVKPVRLPKWEGKFIIGTISRLAAFKRIDRLITAFAAMKVHNDCRLLIVGDGILKAELESMVREMELSNYVEFAGYQRDVAAFQSAMDVCVFPSQGEPFGLVAVETLALGKPTIVMQDGGGITEIIEPLSPDDVVGSVRGLTRRLEHYYRLWKSGDLKDKKQIAERKAQAYKFDVKLMAEAFECIYDTVNCWR